MLLRTPASARALQHVNSTPRSASSALQSQFLSRSNTHQYTTSHPTSPQPSISPALPRPDPSSPHHNLPTFLTHAKRTSLSPTSTTYTGTLYEYLTQSHFTTHLGFSLTRVGGRNDTGIDLLGYWALPQSTTPVRTLIQCKRLTRVAGPNLIRELEGSFHGAPSGWRGDGTLGVMVCSRAATKGVRDAMGRSTRGLCWVMLEEEHEGQEKSGVEDGGGSESLEIKELDGHISTLGGSEEQVGIDYRVPKTRVRQFLYNAAAASKCGLEGVSVGMKYDDTGSKKEVQLLWQGMAINFSHPQPDVSVLG